MQRPIGAVTVIVGTAIVGFSPERFGLDRVILELPRGHGIHIEDLIGSAIVALGIVLLWTAGKSVDS